MVPPFGRMGWHHCWRFWVSVPDPRTGNAQRHGLLDMLVIALVASVCGAESCVDFAEFGEDRGVLLREFLSLENGLPSHDTFIRLFRLLDPAAFGQVFAAFLDDLGTEGAGVMAIDGKSHTFRASPVSPASIPRARSAAPRPPPQGNTCPRPASAPNASPRPCAPIGPSRTPCDFGARHGIRRGPRPRSQGQRPEKPQHSAKTDPQPAPKSPPKTPRHPKAQTRRMVR